MIEPVRSGAALLEEIASADPPTGSVSVWWLGQSGFVLNSGGTTVVIDPYLSEHLTKKYENTTRPHVRMTRSPFRGSELSGVNLILASHKHSDHLDPGTIPGLFAASPGATLVLPESILEHAEAMGLPAERLVGLVSGATCSRQGVTVRAVPSAHEGLDTDDAGRHLYLGFVVEIGGLRFYHSGDTLAYQGLAEAVGGPVNVAFLPINGRDPSRGVPGNMNAAEAVDLANLIRPRFVVPHHYDMFTFNTAPVTDFEAESRRLGVGIQPRVLRCGESWEVHR